MNQEIAIAGWLWIQNFNTPLSVQLFLHSTALCSTYKHSHRQKDVLHLWKLKCMWVMRSDNNNNNGDDENIHPIRKMHIREIVILVCTLQW